MIYYKHSLNTLLKWRKKAIKRGKKPGQAKGALEYLHKLDAAIDVRTNPQRALRLALPLKQQKALGIFNNKKYEIT
jgi:hypothetical protein